MVQILSSLYFVALVWRFFHTAIFYMYLHEIFSPSLLSLLPAITLPASVFFILPLTWCKIYKMAICICLLLILAYFDLEFFKGQLKLSDCLQSLSSQNLLQYCSKSTWNRSDRIRGTTTVVRQFFHPPILPLIPLLAGSWHTGLGLL